MQASPATRLTREDSGTERDTVFGTATCNTYHSEVKLFYEALRVRADPSAVYLMDDSFRTRVAEENCFVALFLNREFDSRFMAAMNVDDAKMYIVQKIDG